MSSSLEQVVSEVLALPQESRALLATRLLESLDKSEDFEVTEEWTREIDQRAEDIDAGRVTLVPAEAALARARNRITASR